MFAVPGWSVSSDAPKAEQVNSAGGSQTAGTKKRKRPGRPQPENVTASNVADLYESVVEGKKSKDKQPSKQEQNAKRQKKDAEAKVKKAAEGKDEAEDETKDKQKGKKHEKTSDKPVEAEPAQSKKSKKDKKKAKHQDKPAQEDTTTATSPPSKDLQPPPLPPAAKLTPLQASMREKLVSARFRHLNETLYTRPSEEAFRLFADAPEMFSEYHEGFRRQVKVWPENPVDSFLADIRSRGRAKPPGKGRPGAPPTPLSKTPLPRTTGACTIADLGCGDARLAESLQADKAKLRVDVRSYDLQSPSPLVTTADIANLPLADGAVNVAVFCLALMGTNWVSFIEEAHRILHWKGELWVAEIKSRFGPVRGKNAVVSHSVGHRKKALGKKGKDDEPDRGEELAVEVDGAEDRRRETDVSAFVEVLRKRGFVPHGDREAVDLSNRMFVKMRFIKAATPTKGKGAKPQEAPRGKKRWPGPNDAEDEEEETEEHEAAILKPCVYKIR